MSTLHIVAYARMAHDMGNAVLQAPAEPNLGYQEVAIGANEEKTAPLPTGTAFVCLVADEDCLVSFQSADHVPIFSGERLFFGTAAGVVLSVVGAKL